jgi:hypothetical protein
MSADYKAHHLGDIVTLLVSETTAASSTGDVNNSRAFAANSAITNLPGTSLRRRTRCLACTSSKSLKGQGETSTGSSVTATVSAHVIALLPNGSMVVEAERKILINSQHEDLIVRGVLRPGDVGPQQLRSGHCVGQSRDRTEGQGSRFGLHWPAESYHSGAAMAAHLVNRGGSRLQGLSVQSSQAVLFSLLFLILAGPSRARAGDSRHVLIRDITTIEGIRENPLIGYSVVVGLNRTGDSQQTQFTTQTLANVLQRLGVQIPAQP